MLVVLYISFSIVIANFVPQRKIIAYFRCSVVLLCCSYFFYNADQLGDLYRHYEVLKRYREVSLYNMLIRDCMLPTVKVSLETRTLNANFNSYVTFYPIYSLYAWIIARIPIKNLLPVLTGFIVYLLPMNVISDFYKYNIFTNRWKLIAAYAFVMLGFSLLEVSGIRCAMATSIFAYFLYCDLFNKKKRTYCWIAYVATCLIHSFCFALLIMRILLVIYQKGYVITSKILMLLFILSTSGVTAIILANISGTGLFVRVIQHAAFLNSLYENNTSSFGYRVVGITLFTCYSIIFLLMLTVLNNSLMYRLKEKDKIPLTRICTFTGFLLTFLIPRILLLGFTTRLRTLFFTLGIYPLLYFLQNFNSNRILQLSSTSKNMIRITLLLFAIIAVFYLTFVISYSSMDKDWRFL